MRYSPNFKKSLTFKQVLFGDEKSMIYVVVPLGNPPTTIKVVPKIEMNDNFSKDFFKEKLLLEHSVVQSSNSDIVRFLLCWPNMDNSQTLDLVLVPLPHDAEQ